MTAYEMTFAKLIYHDVIISQFSGELESVQENAFEVQVELTAYKLR